VGTYATDLMNALRRNRMNLIASLSACALACASACERAPEPKPPAPTAPAAAPSVQAPATLPVAGPVNVPAGTIGGVDPSKWKTSTSADDASVIEVAGLRAPKPASWVWTKPTVQFRTLQYAVAGDTDSTKAAELVVSVFLAGDGGPIDANIARWKGQFRVGDAAPEPKLSTKDVGPMKVEFVELEGDYLSMGAPAPKKDFAQIGAIVQAPGRNVFFRMIGPKATVDANRDAFMKMIDGLMPAN